MSAIVLVDTSILLNVVDVPGRNEQRKEVLDEFEQRIEDEDMLFIPLAAIIETGNHIAHVNGGQLRRQAAERFAKKMCDALNGTAPWKPLNIPNHAELSAWLQNFPDSAMQEISMGDFLIRKEWKQLCNKYKLSRVLIWSLDADLKGFDRNPE